MSLTIADAGGPRPPVELPAPQGPLPAERPAAPQQPQPVPSLPEHRLPAGSTLADTASGTRAQPFDVTLSQLATAVYGTRGGPPEGWSSVSNDELAQRLGQDGQPASDAEVQAWRLQYLGFNDSVETNDQEFRADIYTDGDGNYVLSYRGTSKEDGDWDNNFRQGLGYETRDGDKFSVTAANTGREFAVVFGDGNGDPATSGAHSNLAITGHSQGGGLATVGSIVSGVPAVTFDASGIHPNTWDRLNIDPQAARDIAENGGIRAYSLSSDALTRVQDSWATGLVAPDALGTRIVVEPARHDQHDMFTHYGPIEGFSPEQSQALNTATELGRNPLTGVPIGAVGGGLLGGAVGSLFGPQGGVAGAGIGLLGGPLVTVGGGNLAYAAISHSPNALTEAMIDRQPWQEGYENPSSFGRDAQDLLPGELKDDFARNAHDFATDVDAVRETHFADGQYVQGGASLLGDLAEGFFNSAGDTVDRFADRFAERIEQNVGGRPGSVLSNVVDATGDVIESGADAIGQGVEWLADGAGRIAQGTTNLIGGLFGR